MKVQRMGLASLGSTDNFILDFSHIMNMIMAEATQIERRRLSGSGTKQTPVPGPLKH